MIDRQTQQLPTRNRIREHTKEQIEAGRGLLPPACVAIIVAGIIYTGLVSNSVAAEALASGISTGTLSTSTVTIWQYVREGATAGLAILLLIQTQIRNFARARKLSIPAWFALLGLYCAWQAVRVLLDPALADSYALFGLRFVYIGSLVLSISAYPAPMRRQILRTLAWLLVPMLLIEAATSISQIISGPATLGRTFLGARPWGTYGSSNSLGLMGLGFAMAIAMSDIRLRLVWVATASFICVASGSRNAILGILLLLGGMIISRWRMRLVGVFFLALAAAAVFFVASSSAVSGRAIEQESRFGVWSDSLAALSTPFDILFGKGLGTGSNVSAGLTGRMTESLIISDSTIIMVALSMGVTGLVIFTFAFVAAMRHLEPERRLTLLPPIVLTALVFNLPEVSPFNILAAVLVGVFWRSASAGQPRETDFAFSARGRARPHH